jgi:protein-disulfide isomerase
MSNSPRVALLSLASLTAVASLSACLGGCGGHGSTNAVGGPVRGGAVAARGDGEGGDERLGHGGVGWKQEAKVAIASDDPAIGPQDARVTIVVFGDFQCPYSKKVAPTLKALLQRYGRELRVVWKDQPLEFHGRALPAAIAARVAYMAKGEAAFWRMHDRLFDGIADLSDAHLREWLSEIGVSRADYDQLAPAAEAKVKANHADAERLGVQGTPSFFIDGEALVGAQPLEKFDQIVQAHNRRAGELEASGTPRARLYAEMTDANFKPKPPSDARAAEGAADEPEPDDFTVWNVALGDAPMLGKADALVTVVTFSDFQCPYCKRLEPTLAQLRKEYGDKVRLVFKQNPLPFHARAIPAASFTLEARAQKGNDGFWKAHDKLFALDGLEDGDLEAAAKDLGLDWKKVDGALTADKWKSAIAADVDQAEVLSVQGTPNSFVNGRVVHGAVGYETFKRIVDQELPKAAEKVKAGTPATEVYASIVKGGKSLQSAPLTIPAYAPVRGGKDAKVVIHVFGDFQCPFCKRAEFDVPNADGYVDPNAAGLKVALAKYGNKLRVVWRNYPLGFHKRAEPAAELAICAFKTKGSDAFWKVHDDLYASQASLEDSDLEAVAKRNGLDWPTCKKAIDTHAYKAEIDQDMKEGGAAGVQGTPAFVINGRIVAGAQPFESFQRVIDKALAAAK